MGRPLVERVRRTDDILYILYDRSSPYITYVGKTDLFGAPTTDAVWQIKRITVVGDNEEITYANHGKFNCVWDLRVSYFPPPPPPTPPTNSGLPEEVDIYPGAGTFFDFVGASTPGIEQEVITYTVPANRLLYLHRLTVDCDLVTKFRVTVNGVQVCTGHTGPGRELSQYQWTPYRHVSQGQTIRVFIKVKSAGVAPNVGVHLMVTDTSG